MTVFFLIILPLIFLAIGYFTWQSAYDNYGYNIFGLGVLIRLFIAILACLLDIYLAVGLFVIFSIWNFIVTYRNTSFFIALFAVIFQPVALFFTLKIINRFLND